MGHMLFGFEGRINRAKFWLGQLLIFVALVIIVLIGGGSEGSQIIGTLLMIWPAWALGIKRYHDLDKSGAWVLISFVPFIGPFWYFIEWGFFEGTMGPNRYGPNPLNPDVPDEQWVGER